MSGASAEWTPVVTGDGSITLAHPRHGETCHSAAGAFTQARERYARACRVRARALELAVAGERHFRLLDVGTGLGLNLAAALEALEGTGVVLEATSLEIDAGVIRACLALGPQPVQELERVHAAVRASLGAALAGPPNAPVALAAGTLRLALGDGRRTLAELDPHPAFDAVFLDPFSPAVDPLLWEPEFLAGIARRMDADGLLSTYSAALRVRAGLAAAGLCVGPGARVQRKAQGTLASRGRALPAFDARTARRIEARRMALGAAPSAAGTAGDPGT